MPPRRARPSSGAPASPRASPPLRGGDPFGTGLSHACITAEPSRVSAGAPAVDGIHSRLAARRAERPPASASRAVQRWCTSSARATRGDASHRRSTASAGALFVRPHHLRCERMIHVLMVSRSCVRMVCAVDQVTSIWHIARAHEGKHNIFGACDIVLTKAVGGTVGCSFDGERACGPITSTYT